MEVLIVAAGAAGILALIAFLSPGVERGRPPVHAMVGRDHHASRVQRASFAAQVTQRNAPRPLRVTGDRLRPVEEAAPMPPVTAAAAAFMASAQVEDHAAQLPLPASPPVAPRLGWARQASESSSRNQREHQADGLVASLLGPAARA